MKIGVIVESFRLSLAEGIRQAKRLGATGVQFYAPSLGALVDRGTRLAFRRWCEAEDVEITALVSEMGGYALGRREELPLRLARVKEALALASDLGVGVVSDHIGVIPEDPASPVRAWMLEAVREIGAQASRCGVRFAIETGPETAAVLCGFLEEAGSRGLGVNLDPANFVMVTGDDPVRAVTTLREWIVHTHAKDGEQLQPCDPATVAAVYEAFAEGGFARLIERTGALFREVALGEGAVDWSRYLTALRTIGYTGYLTIERETGAEPARDIRQAVEFLKAELRQLRDA